MVCSSGAMIGLSPLLLSITIVSLWNVKTRPTETIFIALQSSIFALISNSVSFKEMAKSFPLCESM